MNNSSIEPKSWQIWLAYVRFSDNPAIGKIRPVVVIDKSTVAIIAAKITSARPHSQYQYYELLDWKDEGLLKPSRIQLAPLLALKRQDLLNDEPLGYLSERDRIGLLQSLL